MTGIQIGIRRLHIEEGPLFWFRHFFVFLCFFDYFLNVIWKKMYRTLRTYETVKSCKYRDDQKRMVFKRCWARIMDQNNSAFLGSIRCVQEYFILSNSKSKNVSQPMTWLKIISQNKTKYTKMIIYHHPKSHYWKQSQQNCDKIYK
jgi:hypothetical protein